MLNIAVCVSGGGTNLQAIIDAIENGKIRDTQIAFVYSNNRAAYALTRAQEAGIPTHVISPSEFPTREEFNEAFSAMMCGENPDLIVLAGCLIAIPPKVVRAFPERIINIHPSLIPSFCGRGYYGLKVHEAVLERGVRVTGATVHFVDEGMDTGPILLQRAVEVAPDDTPGTLQYRVMEQAEWVILPKAIDLIAHDRVLVEEGRVRILS